MSEESQNSPAPNSPPEQHAGDDSAAAAKEAAKDFADNAGQMFKGMDTKLQIYLTALGITALCSLFFGAYTVSFKSTADGGAFGAFAEQMVKSTGNKTSNALVGLGDSRGGAGGKLAFLGAIAGIGILIWSKVAKRVDAWIPLALAGAAGLAVLGILVTRSGTGGESNELMKVSVDGTLLGWWLPFLGAVIATVVSVQRILKA